MIYRLFRLLDDWQHRLYAQTHWPVLDHWSWICDKWEALNACGCVHPGTGLCMCDCHGYQDVHDRINDRNL